MTIKQLQSGFYALYSDKGEILNAAPMDKGGENMKKYTIFIVWGYIHKPNTPMIKIAGFSTKKAAKSFISQNGKYYECMEIRTFTGMEAKT